MGSLKRRDWWCPISLFVVFVAFISSAQQSQGAYNEQYLDSMGCNGDMKKISLSNFANNTFVLKLSRWTDYHLPSAFMKFQCHFQVIAPKGHGIMAVTQGLHLRTKSKQSCRDYVKFQQNDGRDTKPICGEVNVSDHNVSPKTLIGPRSFYDPHGALDVFFSADDSVADEVQKPIFLQLVFTAHSECTSLDLITHKIRSCSEGKGNACIASSLFCDGKINCGFRGDFAADERDCAQPDSTKADQQNEITGFGLDHNNVKGKSSRGNLGDEDHHEHLSLGSVPIHVFALISAAAGGLVVLLLIFICCCLGRIGTLSTRNQVLRQQPQPQETIHMGLSHSSVTSATGGPSFIARMTPSAKLVKPREDLPPPYDAIFPHPQRPEKK